MELNIPKEKFGWFGAIYPEGEGLDGLELYIPREKGWMVWS